MSTPASRFEQLGELLTAMIALIFKGNSGLQPRPTPEKLAADDAWCDRVIAALRAESARINTEAARAKSAGLSFNEEIALLVARGEFPGIKNGSLRDLWLAIRIDEHSSGLPLTEQADLIAAAGRLAERGLISLAGNKVGLPATKSGGQQ